MNTRKTVGTEKRHLTKNEKVLAPGVLLIKNGGFPRARTQNPIKTEKFDKDA